MKESEENHIGQNIQKIRKFRGIKQSDFAKAMGVNQQNISRMENSKEVSEEKIEQASKILDATAKQIKELGKSVIVNNNVFSNDQINFPIAQVLEHFQGVIDDKDQEIVRLKEELSRKNTRKVKTNTPIKAQLKKA
jgi:transcriptional regulator with XRE-family HTH domain